MKNSIMLLLVLSAGVLAACGSNNDSKPAPVVFTLVATDIAYDIDQIESTVGNPVKITLRNEGTLEHDFTVMSIPLSGEIMAEGANDGMAGHDMGGMADEPEIHIAPTAGEALSIEFTPAAPGEYAYFCTVEGHKEAGMVGTLTVKAP